MSSTNGWFPLFGDMIVILTIPGGGFFSNATATMVSVWVMLWGIRRKGEFDYQLDEDAKRVRWLIVVSSMAFSYLSAVVLDSTWCVLGGWIVATAFLAWPNFAYHLTNLLRRIRVLPKANDTVFRGP